MPIYSRLRDNFNKKSFAWLVAKTEYLTERSNRTLRKAGCERENAERASAGLFLSAQRKFRLLKAKAAARGAKTAKPAKKSGSKKK